MVLTFLYIYNHFLWLLKFFQNNVILNINMKMCNAWTSVASKSYKNKSYIRCMHASLLMWESRDFLYNMPLWELICFCCSCSHHVAGTCTLVSSYKIQLKVSCISWVFICFENVKMFLLSWIRITSSFTERQRNSLTLRHITRRTDVCCCVNAKAPQDRQG